MVECLKSSHSLANRPLLLTKISEQTDPVSRKELRVQSEALLSNHFSLVSTRVVKGLKQERIGG